MAWEERFGITLADEEAVALRTPRAAIDLICRKLGVTQDRRAGDGCLSQRGFYSLRRAFQTLLFCSRSAVTPRTRVSDLVPPERRHAVWLNLPAHVGVSDLPGLKPGLGWFYGRCTVGDLVQHVVAHQPKSLPGEDAVWTRFQVRETVRAVIADQLGVQDFSDDGDFVYDLGMD